MSSMLPPSTLEAAAEATGVLVDDIRALAEMTRDNCFPFESLRDVTRSAFLLYRHSAAINSINAPPIAFPWAFIELSHYAWMVNSSSAATVMLCRARAFIVAQDHEAGRRPWWRIFKRRR